MIIFLYGADIYRLKKKLNEIIEAYKRVHKSFLNMLFFDALRNDFKDFFNEIRTVSIFSGKKLVILKNIFENQFFQEAFSQKINEIKNLKDILIIYKEGEIAQDNKFLKILKKNSNFQEFKPLSHLDLKKWVVQEFLRRKIKIEKKAQDLLLAYIGNDLWRMKNEIEKLVNYKKEGIIKKEDVKLLVKPNIENDIFKTINALASCEKEKAFILIHKHLEKGENPLYLLSMIAYQFKNLLIIKEITEKRIPYSLITKRCKLSPFVIKKSYYLSYRFSFLQLKKIYQRIFEIDSEIKKGKIEPEMALDLLISEI